MAAMRFEQVQRFTLAKKIFWGYGHFNGTPCVEITPVQLSAAEKRGWKLNNWTSIIHYSLCVLCELFIILFKFL